MSGELDVRVGDAERAAVVDRLAAHFRDGRIDEEELEERTAAANAARTRGDLVKLEADLPEPPKPVDLAAQRRRRRERIVSALTIPAFLWVIYCATDFGGFPWPIFPTAFFVMGLIGELWGGDDHRRHHHGRNRHALREQRRERRDLRR
jgi:hypothetical protein